MDSYNSPPKKIRRSEEHVPEELVEEIVSRLPVKSVLRFKCVAKSWQCLIGSQKFIRKHLQKSTNNPCLPYHKVLILQRRLPKQYNLQSLLKNDPSIDPSSAMAMATDDHQTYDNIVGCCNGLVCIVEESMKSMPRFMLWNPATRISKKLPMIHNREKQDLVTNLGFGWDESSGAYKVFAILFLHEPINPGAHVCKVYSSKTNSWKTLELPHSFLPDPIYGHGQFVCGKIHWPKVHGDNNIVFFDLKSEEFGMMEAPPCKPEPGGLFSLLLGEIGGCLGAVYESRNKNSILDVWVMKELSWEKLATIPDSHQPGTYNPFKILFKGGVDGELLLVNRDTLSVRFAFASFYRAGVYVESLVSPLLLH